MTDSIQHVTIKFKWKNRAFWISGIYARCNALERLELWDKLMELKEECNCLWIIGGDFNVILNEEEKLGGLEFEQTEAIDFGFFINNCELEELKFSGSKFTWWDSKAAEDCIFKRLEKILVNQEFMNLFPASKVIILLGKGRTMSPCI